jgi:hypothetical protein
MLDPLGSVTVPTIPEALIIHVCCSPTLDAGFCGLSGVPGSTVVKRAMLFIGQSCRESVGLPIRPIVLFAHQLASLIVSLIMGEWGVGPARDRSLGVAAAPRPCRIIIKICLGPAIIALINIYRSCVPSPAIICYTNLIMQVGGWRRPSVPI